MGSLICPHADNCSGCSQWDIPYAQQLQRKQEHLKAGLIAAEVTKIPQIQILSAGEKHLRDRMDFVIEEGRAGLFSKSSQQIVDLPECYLLSPELQKFYSDFRKIRWPITRGSFRLRVNPDGKRGAWLDFANLDIKNLIDEQKILRRLQDLCFVEVGQRRKSLKANDKKVYLADPELHFWNRSLFRGTPIRLYSCVGSFSQTGQAANSLITQRIAELAQKVSPASILEYGAGNGNLSFPSITSDSTQLSILETDELSLEGLMKTAQELEVASQITILSPQNRIMDFSSHDLILANPPRSGLNALLQKMSSAEKHPRNFIYMSCFAESFFKDARVLKELGYGLNEIDIIDQFPQTSHYEIISYWTLKT